MVNYCLYVAAAIKKQVNISDSHIQLLHFVDSASL